MICVYDPTNTAFSKNGDVILTPTSGKVKQIAGGNCELTLTHPIDLEGKWRHLVPDAVIRAPVPRETITNAKTGMEADVYVLTEDAALREGPSEPSPINYGGWSAGTVYSVGSKVTYGGRNYQCTSFDETSGYVMVPPPNSPWWREIARYTSGSPVVMNMRSGMELYYISGPENGWYYMSTTYGLEGYIKASQVQFSRHLTPEDTKPRVVETQLFRIRTVTVDTKSHEVNVTAQHVSYDLNGVLIDSVKLRRKSAPQSLAWIEAAFMIDYQGTIATDIPIDTDAEYSCDISGKSGMFALLDPDSGVVSCFDAEFRRDNWDLFVMEKKHTDRGFRLRYGNNLKGVNWKIAADKLVTRVVPVAKAEDGSDLYLDVTKWVDSTHINDYPVIRMERLKVNGQVGKDDGSETATNWTLQTLRAEMQKQAQNRFDVDKADIVQHEITVEFEMMGDTEEYKQLKKLQEVLLYDTVTVIHEVIGLSVTVEVSELEFDVLKEKITALKLTNVNSYNVRNVTGFNVLENSITAGKLTDDAGDGIRDAAVDISNVYTDAKAQSTLSSSKSYTDSHTSEYVGSTHGYSNFESYIKWWVDNH